MVARGLWHFLTFRHITSFQSLPPSFHAALHSIFPLWHYTDPPFIWISAIELGTILIHYDLILTCLHLQRTLSSNKVTFIAFRALKLKVFFRGKNSTYNSYPGWKDVLKRSKLGAPHFWGVNWDIFEESYSSAERSLKGRNTRVVITTSVLGHLKTTSRVAVARMNNILWPKNDDYRLRS